MRMLGLWPIRAQGPFFRGFLRAGLPDLLLLEVPAHEKQRDDSGDEKSNGIVHTNIFSYG
jgi:hypothetical protein